MSDIESVTSESEYISDESDDFVPTSAVKKKPLSRPLSDSTNTPPTSTPASIKSTSKASDQYQRLSQLEHILKRPDTYIGSVERSDMEMWCFECSTESMVYRKVNIVPGLYKIFDEILVNAADNKIRDPSMKNLKVKIDPENNIIQVMNDGKGIPVEIHEKEKIYIPEMIFGNLLTSSNYDDNEKKVTGGRNGYGAKLCNIFSMEFILETADLNTGLIYRQTWTDNMSKVTKPKISKLKTKKEYTKITFKPDLSKFQMDSLDDEILSVLRRRVYDLCATVKDCNIYLNDKKLNIRNFKSYVEMYVDAIRQRNPEPEQVDGEIKNYKTIVYEAVNDRWELAFAVSDGNFNQVSFVNSIATTSGGTHVRYISEQIISKLIETLSKKEKNKKKLKIKSHEVRNNMFLFVNSLIENPAFTSQTKEQLTTKVTQFGGKPNEKVTITDKFINEILKTSIVDKIRSIVNANEDKELQKADGSRKSRIKNQVKLVDANKAGTKDGHKCTLILTEGDSALSLAVAGLAVIGRDYYGCFPLRGKLLNVREASTDQISKNAEIKALKQIIGLQHKKTYNQDNIKDLRYGHIMIMTDQDQDGSHIKGLIINFLETSFPGLLEIPGFLLEFITPIVKVTIKKRSGGKEVIPFYSMPEFERWRSTEGENCTWTQKYYKGLGTSTTLEAREYFAALDKHLKTFHALQGDDQDLIDLAFSKKKADDRKEWLQGFQPGTHLDPQLAVIPISDFINKELILFSMADNVRSIPSVLDGLKPGQRKVLFGCFKKNIKTEIKVAQLAAYVSEHTAYHHGEQSLVQTIVGLAQNFVGSNNLNLLEPIGCFGTRAAGGKDFSAARYIHTAITEITKKIFNPLDNGLYTYVQEDEQAVEPEWYLPVIPMVLVNGAEGIGTGWSTNIPQFNPVDIVKNIRKLMNGEELDEMVPWYRGWEGFIESHGNDKFKLMGKIEQVDEKTLEITEIPIKTWTNNVKEFLLNGLGTDKTSPWIKDVEEQHGLNIKFIVKLSPEEMQKSLKIGLLDRFKLTSVVSLNNMVAFDPLGKIKKYGSPLEILKDYYYVRLEYYQKRKDFMTHELQIQITKLNEQARFIKLIIDKKLSVSNKKRSVLFQLLQDLKFVKFNKNGKPVEKDINSSLFVEDEAIIKEEEQQIGDATQLITTAGTEESQEHKPESAYSYYNYLLGMTIWSLTKERYEKLLQQRDEKEQELINLLKLSAKDLWNSDLEEFLEEWDKFLQQDYEERSSMIPSKGTKRKAKKTRKTKKDSEEDAHSQPPKKKQATIAKASTVVPSTKPDGPENPSIKKEQSTEPQNLLSVFSKDSGSKKPKEKPKQKPSSVTHSRFSDSEDDELLGLTPSKISSSKPAPAIDARDKSLSKSGSAKSKATLKNEVADLDSKLISKSPVSLKRSTKKISYEMIASDDDDEIMIEDHDNDDDDEYEEED